MFLYISLCAFNVCHMYKKARFQRSFWILKYLWLFIKASEVFKAGFLFVIYDLRLFVSQNQMLFFVQMEFEQNFLIYIQNVKKIMN